MELYYWEGEHDKETQDFIKGVLTFKDPNFTTMEMKEDEKEDTTFGDKTYSWLITPYGWLKIESEQSKRMSKIPIGVKDSKYYLTFRAAK